MITFLITFFKNELTISNVLGCVIVVGLALWALRHFRHLSCVLRSLPRDLLAASKFIRVARDLKYFQAFNYTIAKAFDDMVNRNPKKIVLVFEDEKLTAEFVQKLSYQIANHFQIKGLKKGDTVAIFMENRPEFIPIWLGLSRLGCIASLVNYNLRNKSLKHCFEAVNCKAIIYSPELSDALEEIVENGLEKSSLYCVGQVSEKLTNLSQNLKDILKNVSEKPPILTEVVGFLDPLMFIYTSGTTGLPKAATIKHSRYFMAAVGNFYVHGIKSSDTLYTALPLYHGSGTMLGTGTMLIYGVTQVIRNKFSATNFWKDCIRYNCTVAQYIGEICRYILNQPNSPLDKSHTVRVMFGNGLKAEIWKDFVRRFNIKHISELYGATEGNCNMVNIDGKIGAVGFVPMIFPSLLPLKLIKVDDETRVPLRDEKTGFCIKCKPNEPGELIGKIKRNHPIYDFQGYADKNSSNDKVLYGAFRKGDAWFRSGDLLVQDELGYFFFKDRTGDTFRWKGENCSTNEIEGIISTAIKEDVVVFGVEIPGAEGKAGMAVVPKSCNLDQLYGEISKLLPRYAIPLFIRLTPKLEITGTYKLKKIDYQKVGYNLHQTNDQIYFLDGKSYIPLSPERYDDIASGKLRV